MRLAVAAASRSACQQPGPGGAVRRTVTYRMRVWLLVRGAPGSAVSLLCRPCLLLHFVRRQKRSEKSIRNPKRSPNSGRTLPSSCRSPFTREASRMRPDLALPLPVKLVCRTSHPSRACRRFGRYTHHLWESSLACSLLTSPLLPCTPSSAIPALKTSRGPLRGEVSPASLAASALFSPNSRGVTLPQGSPLIFRQSLENSSPMVMTASAIFSPNPADRGRPDDADSPAALKSTDLRQAASATIPDTPQESTPYHRTRGVVVPHDIPPPEPVPPPPTIAQRRRSSTNHGLEGSPGM